MRYGLQLALGLVLVLAPGCARSQPAQAPATGELATSVVSGAAGPFAHATITLRRDSREPGAPFSGTLAVQGKTLALAGPTDPADVFIYDVNAVLFTPIDRGRGNGVVVLYTSSQIGPDHGSEHLALVYRVTADAATRQPTLEHRLEGVIDAAQARRRLAARR